MVTPVRSLPGELRVEDETRAAGRRPAHALRVAPPLVADGDAERDAIDLEQPAPAVGHVERFFLEGDLVLGLVADDLAVARDDERHVVQPGGGFPLHAHDGRHAVPLGRGADLLERRLLAALVVGRDGKVVAAQPGEVGLREADDGHVPRGRLPQEALDRLEPLLDGRRVPRGGQPDAERRSRVHLSHWRRRYSTGGAAPEGRGPGRLAYTNATRAPTKAGGGGGMLNAPSLPRSSCSSRRDAATCGARSASRDAGRSSAPPT